MKICLVTAFPPSRRLLNEYGFHLARELRRHPLVSLTILADELETPEPELDGFDVVRCWQLNRLFNQKKILSALRETRPDIVWFNLLFSTFGNGHNPLAAFSGMTLPALTRAAGFCTHVTLHHLMDHVDLADAGIRHERLYRLAGALATHMVLRANSVSVLLPAFRHTLMTKYGGENVHFRAHGILSGRPEPPDFSHRGNPEQRILVFGKWGTYKRLELMLEAFAEIVTRAPNSRLIVAGGDHPMAPGYIDSLRAVCRDPRIQFTGYVAETAVPELFRSASVLVMPYSSATGASGVAHLACEYGLPIVCSDLADFRSMAEEEDIAIDFCRLADAKDLAGQVARLLLDQERQRTMAEQNFTAALRITMPRVILQYLRGFDLDQRRRALEPIMRFRRMPEWVPSNSVFLRAAQAASRWSPWM
jgi:glycosyltransferase involved in cell wall biosynthesis